MMNIRNRFIAILSFLLLISNIVLAQDHKVNEYKYDKDKNDIIFAVMSDNPGQQAGMHFNIGTKKQKIEKISIFIAGGNIENIKANIHIIMLKDDNKNTDISIPFIPYAIGKWNEFNLSERNIEISDNVIIGVEWETPTGEKDPYVSFLIGADINVSNHNGYIKYPNGDWFPARRFGSSGAKNFYIRLYTSNN